MKANENMAQQILFDENAASSLQQVLVQYGIQHSFIIRGRHFAGEQLHSISHNSYCKEDAEVTKEEIARCYELFTKTNADGVIAIGGGRVIDLAKAVIHMHRMANHPPLRTFIAMPTTAGSGSEATQFAVVYDHKTKISLDEPFLLPGVAILDPVLTYSLPPLQTAVSGIDALAQAIESYWNVRANEAASTFAASAITTLLAHLPGAIHQPETTNRRHTLWGAHLAGKAINITRTTGPHALSYFLTANYNIPHGQAVALFLPLFFLYNAGVQPQNCNHPDGIDTVLERLNQLYKLLNVKDASEAAAYLRDFIKNAGLATTLKEYGIDKTAILDTLLLNINKERFNNNPVSLDIDTLRKTCINFL